MKKIVIGLQTMMLLASLPVLAQATFSKEMLERNLREKKLREDAYQTSQAEIVKRKEEEARIKKEKDSLVKVKDLELKNIWAEEAKKREEEAEEQTNLQTNLQKEEIMRNVESEDINKDKFIFDRVALNKLEKSLEHSYSDDQKNTYSFIFLINENTANIDDRQKVKLSSFLQTDQFVNAGGSLSTNDFHVIKNIKNQKLYAIHKYTKNWHDYSPSSLVGHKELVIYISKPLSAEKQQLLKRYKVLIKNGQTNTLALKSIQNKCLTKGYFDERKMSKIDKQIWNKNYADLKSTYAKLSDIDQFEDNDKQVQNKLSTAELLSLNGFNSWLINFSTLN